MFARPRTNKQTPARPFSLLSSRGKYSAILMPNLSHSTNFYDQVFNKAIPRTVKVRLLIASVLRLCSHGIFTSALIADRPCLLFWFECSNNLAICPLLLFTPNSLFHSQIWDNLDFLKRKLSMLFVPIHRIIFHDKNLMDEEILKTASNAAIKAMTVLL